MLALVKNLDNFGVECEVVFCLPDENRSKVTEQFHAVKIEYLWESKWFSRNKYLKYVSYWLALRKKRRFAKRGDVLYVYSDVDILQWVSGKKGVNVFYETTEHPDVHKPYSKLRKITRKRYVKICKELSGIFVISSSLKIYFLSIGIQESRIHILNMTVDPSRFDGVEKKQLARRQIVFCGTIKNSIDGVDKLIESFAIIAPRFPDVDLHILGKTDGVADAAKDMELVMQIGLKDRVFFEGMIPAHEVPQHLKNACVLALFRPNCLQADAGFPTKLGEYLLSGNPVAVTSVGDIPQYLQNGVSAMISSPNDVNAFANNLSQLLCDKNMSERIGREGKDIAMKYFSAREVSKSFCDWIGEKYEI